MSKKELEKINRWLTRWKPRLLLGKWAILPAIDRTDPTANKDGSLDMACITVDTVQSEAHMVLYPRLWEESREYQETTVCHELCHIHTETIRQLLQKAARAGAVDRQVATNALEDLTNTISKLVYTAYKKPKKSTQYHV